MKNISINNILSLHPSFSFAEDEVYLIQSALSSWCLQVYLNSDSGCEYSLYNEEYEEVDGGVVDDFEAEREEECARFIFELLEEMNVEGEKISKLSAEEIVSFEVMAQRRWEEKVKEAKRITKEEKEK